MEGQPRPKPKRNLAYPLPIGSDVPFEGRVKECAELIEPCDRLLDVGCSSGWLAPLVLGKAVRSYIGVDRVIVGADQAPEGAKFVEGSIFELPFESGSVDAATLFDVIEHLPRHSEARALLEVGRILRPGGKLYLSTPHASWVHTPLDPVWIFGHRHYRRATVRRVLENTGFTMERLFVAGGVVELLNHWRLLFYKHGLHRPLPVLKVVHDLIERSHGRDHAIGMTVFAIARKPVR